MSCVVAVNGPFVPHRAAGPDQPDSARPSAVPDTQALCTLEGADQPSPHAPTPSSRPNGSGRGSAGLANVQRWTAVHSGGVGIPSARPTATTTSSTAASGFWRKPAANAGVLWATRTAAPSP